MIFPDKHLEYVKSLENDVDPLFVLSIIKVESNFKQDAYSNKGAKGLMQIMDSTASWVSEKTNQQMPRSLYDANENIKIGVWYLNWLKNKYEDNDLVLAAYNAGTGNVNKWLQDNSISVDGKTLKYIPFEETSNYLVKVNFTYKMYKAIYSDFAWITQFF